MGDAAARRPTSANAKEKLLSRVAFRMSMEASTVPGALLSMILTGMTLRSVKIWASRGF